MPCPHFDVKIIKRSQAPVSCCRPPTRAANGCFPSTTRNRNTTTRRKNLSTPKSCCHPMPRRICRPGNLWNAAEAMENQWNSQLARRIVLAFPVEVPKEQYADLIRDYCQEQFVSKGMIADFAIHDKGDGNPHAHILLTIRAMDEHGKWLPESPEGLRP